MSATALSGTGHTSAAGGSRRSLVPHLSALDGARAVAALGVLVNHVALLSGFTGRHQGLGQYLARAEVGVSIFFVLSGYLLYRPFVADRLAGREMRDVRDYARRRILRILPAYWLALTVIGFVLRAPGFDEPHSIVSHYLLLQIYDINQVVGGPVQQAWTLATEVSFYVFLPFWAWLLARRPRTPARQLRLEIAGVAVLWGGAMALKLAAVASNLDGEQIGMLNTWLPFRMDEFALGMGIAVAAAWFQHRKITLPTKARAAALTIGSWVVAAVLYWFLCTQLDMPLGPIYTPRQSVVLRALYAFVALFVILPAVFASQDRGPARAVLANRPIVWVGLVSYGIYLWHEAFQDVYLRITDQPPLQASALGMLAFTTVASFAAAAASWYLLERPVMRWGRHRRLE
ncbi:acyltransferase family protein [Dermatobacter hominis]|uniref:acyltransferase family protein n=1 Tax=Dermatobacter hominis TaxID=2884263 RepID=UPI001D117C33|nr:acyltransferase [Dermatobacter hominis]UDY36470.1 acyltransferase [Dermatobacter hominis]